MLIIDRERETHYDWIQLQAKVENVVAMVGFQIVCVIFVRFCIKYNFDFQICSEQEMTYHLCLMWYENESLLKSLLLKLTWICNVISLCLRCSNWEMLISQPFSTGLLFLKKKHTIFVLSQFNNKKLVFFV